MKLQRWSILVATAVVAGTVFLTPSPAVAELPPGERLLNAIASDDLPAVRFLLDQGVDPNYRSTGVGTPLAQAAMKGNADIVDELLKRGAQVDLARPGDGMTALLWAAKSGNPRAVQLLIDAHADVNHRSGIGFFPLNAAACNGRDIVVRQLLDAGARVDEADHLGRTALMCAARNGDEGIVEMLLERNAEIDRRSGMDETALSLAAETQQAGAVRVLLAHGAQVPPGKHANRQR